VSLEIVGAHLIVLGGSSGEPLLISGSSTALVDGRATGTCTVATVDPTNLSLTAVAHGNCGDPSLYRERVLPIDVRVSRRGATSVDSVRIATANPAARDGYQLGPSIVTSPDCSGCQPQWVYGDRSLWIYAGAVGKLLRISAQSGRVQQTWTLPALTSPLLAVNSDGAWIAPSLLSTVALNRGPAQQDRYESLYRISPGARTPTRTLSVKLPGANWLVASGHTVWLDLAAGTSPARVWRLQGPNASSATATRLPGASRCAQYGTGPAKIVGDPTIGVSCVVGTGQVVGLTPDAGAERTIATIRAPYSTGASGPPQAALPGAALGRSFFYINPWGVANPAAPSPGRAEILYRIRL
jgi:hypothetical protein